MALIYLGYRKLKGKNKKKGDDSEEVEEKTVESEMKENEKKDQKKKSVITRFLALFLMKFSVF